MAGVSSLAVSSNTANSSYYLTGSFTPHAGSVLVAFVASASGVPNDAWLEVTTERWRRFTLVNKAIWDGGFSKLYAFVANGSSSGAPCVVRFDCASSPSQGTIIQVLEVTSVSRVGLDLIRQSAIQEGQAASTRPNPTFSIATSSINSILGAVANNSSLAAMLPPTSWTEASDTGIATPSIGLETVYLGSGAASTVITWGSSSSSLCCSMVLEIDSTVPDQLMGDMCDVELIRVY